MSTQQQPLKENEKVIQKSTVNFLKMLNEEKSEAIKINYWIGLENMIKKLKVDSKMANLLIFENILNKNLDILKMKDLTFCILNYLRNSNVSKFTLSFFELMYNFANVKFEENKIYLQNYLLNFSFDLFFDKENSNNNEDILQKEIHFFKYVLESDSKFFVNSIYLYLHQNSNFVQKILFKEKKNIQLLNLIINSFITKNKIKNLYFFLTTITQYEIEEGTKIFFFSSLLKSINEALFSSSQKEHFFILLLNFLLDSISPLSIGNSLLDEFLTKIVNTICSNSILDIDILKYLLSYYNNKELPLLNFKTIFPISLYFSVDFISTLTHINFFIQNVIPSLSSLFSSLILKQLSLTSKQSYFTLANTPKPKLSFSLVKSQNLLSKIDIVNSLSTTSQLNLMNYIINSSMNVKDNTTELNQSLLSSIITSIVNSSLNIDAPLIYNNISLFCIDVIAVIIDYAIASSLSNVDVGLIKAMISMIAKTNKEFQSSTVYPSIVSIIRILIQSYDNFNKDIIISFIDYLIVNFSTEEKISNLVFKLLVSLFNYEKIKTNEGKIIAMEKLVELCVLANNLKLFEFFFNFCIELMKDEKKKRYAYYAITLYAKSYDRAIHDKLINFVLEKYTSLFVDNKETFFSEEALLCIESLSYIYLKDKPSYLQKTIDMSCLKKKFIPTIENMLKHIDDTFFDISNDNVIEKYKQIKEKMNSIEGEKIFKKILVSNESVDKDTITIAILKYYSRLVSEHIRLMIVQSTESSNENNNSNSVDSLFDSKEEIKKEINTIFDFINAISVSSTGIKGSVVLNEILSHEVNYFYYMIEHSNENANKIIKEQNGDFSQLRKITTDITNEKIVKLFDYMMNNISIIILNNLWNLVFNIECGHAKSKSVNKHAIITTIWKNDILLKKQNEKKNEQKDNIALTQLFLKEMFSIDKMNNNMYNYIYCLDNNVFFTNFRDINIDYDYIMISYYAIMKFCSQHCELRMKFLNFIYDVISYNNSEKVHIFILRVLQSKFYNILLSNDNQMLYNIVKSSLMNLIQYNSYKEESIDVIKAILLNLQSSINKNMNDAYSFVEMIKSIYDFALNKHKEISIKMKNELLSIINTSLLPKLIEQYNEIINVELNTENDLYPLYEILNDIIIITSFNKVLSLKELIKENEFYKKLMNVLDLPATKNIFAFTNANLNKMIEIYSKEENENEKVFIEGMFLYISFNHVESFNRYISDIIALFNSEDKIMFMNNAVFMMYIKRRNEKIMTITRDTFSIGFRIGETMIKEGKTLIEKNK